MRHQWIIMGALCGILTMPTLGRPVPAPWGPSSKYLSFDNFPTPRSLGEINDTQWDGDEMIVDVHTIMNERRATEPNLSHFLLLIVAGERRGVQRIPLEPGADRRAEEEI